jgi:hypothetical protein
MKQLIFGAILGSLLTAGLGLAGTFYNDQGAPNAPTGSVQQFDYFRWRGTQLDIQRMERGQEQERIERLTTKPCAR